MKGPPNTSNKEAAALIERARFKCAGCRMSWRLRSDNNHRIAKSNSPCKAVAEREALREIARKARSK